MSINLCSPQLWNPRNESPLHHYDATNVSLYNSSTISKMLDQGSIVKNIVPTPSNAYGPVYAASDATYGYNPSATFPIDRNVYSDTYPSTPEPVTSYVVAKIPYLFSAASVLFQGDASNRGVILNTSGKLYMTANGITGPVTAQYAYNTKIVLCAYFAGNSTSSLWVNDSVTPAVTGSCGSSNPRGICIGSDYGSSPWRSSIYSLTYFDGSHSAATRARIMFGLGNKVGVEVT